MPLPPLWTGKPTPPTWQQRRLRPEKRSPSKRTGLFARCHLKFSSHFPKLRKQHDLQHRPQIGRAGGTAGSPLQSDDTLHRSDMIEAPSAKIILEIDQFLGELVKQPILRGRCVDDLPCLHHRAILGARFTPARPARIFSDIETVSRQ